LTDKETLFAYRLEQAEETLSEVERMLKDGYSARTVVNRAYYALFYSLLALFIKTGISIRTSKHSGIISVFDREFIKTEKLDKRYSRIIHNLFDDRQEGDYREFTSLSADKAAEHVALAREFVEAVKNCVKNSKK
jgi:uncharacterized protein (UPF0332 family)